MVITPTKRKSNFTEFLKNWFNFSEGGRNIINLILQDYFYKGAFNENKFLNLIRAIELFHVYKYPGTIISKKEYKDWLNGIISYIPVDLKKEVRDKLQFQNELTLDIRLRVLVGEISNTQIGFDYHFDENFIKQVKNSRNYYTHYNVNLKNKALVGQDLIKMTESCRALLNFLILKHLGINEDILSKNFKFYFENSYYSYYYN